MTDNKRIQINSNYKIPKFFFTVLFDYLDFESCENLTKSFMQTLFRKYQLNILKSVKDGFNIYDNYDDYDGYYSKYTRSFVNSCKNGSLHVAKWLFKNYKIYIYPKVFEYACKNGHLQVAKWLHYNNIIVKYYRYDKSFLEACKNQHFEVMGWLCSIEPRYSFERDSNGVSSYTVVAFS